MLSKEQLTFRNFFPRISQQNHVHLVVNDFLMDATIVVVMAMEKLHGVPKSNAKFINCPIA